MAECLTGATSSNIIDVKHESTGIQNTPPNTETTPGQGHVPIVNNARVPIVFKVVSNMHPSYTHIPLQPPFFVANPYTFFYHRNY